MKRSAGGRRGRTRSGRLAAFDTWLLQSSLLDAQSHLQVVDVGVGDQPDTTVELFTRLQAVHPTVRVTGIDHEPSRVERAQVEARPGLQFLHDGFELQSLVSSAHLIRACNVLRGYSPMEVREAQRTMSQRLVERGWLVDATTSVDGHICVALLMQREAGQLHRRQLFFYTDGTQGFSPLLFRNLLPRDLRRTARNGHPMEVFFDAWVEAWEDVRHESECPFRDSVERLSVPQYFRWEAPGVALWRPDAGVPHRDGSYGAIDILP